MLKDFLIVGAGAVGLTTAQALLQAGYRVTLMERGSVGQEASWAGGGILSPLCSWDYQEAVTRLAHRSMEMFGETVAMLYAATGIDPEYQRSGMLLLLPYQDEPLTPFGLSLSKRSIHPSTTSGRTDIKHPLIGQAMQWCAQHQFPLQQVNLADYLPGRDGAGLLLPEVAQVRNPRLLSALRTHVEKLGGVILEQQEVQRFEIADDRVVALHTAQGKRMADAYIVAAGAWSKVLLGEYALNIDIRPIRGQILLFKFDAPPFRHILLRQDLYLIPRRDGHVLVGSTLEDVGFDKSTTDEARESLMGRVCEIFPEWHGMQPIRHWAGFRPGSPDNIPTIGRHPRIANLYANSGHFRYGVTMSLASAELLRNEIEGRPQPFPVEEYRWR